MHFFIQKDASSGNIPGTETLSYGPASSSVFNVTTQFQLTTATKAYACMKGWMIVHQSAADPSLVNVIIKPRGSFEIEHFPVKYFVYRGILKNSFVSPSSNNVVIARNTSGQTDLMTRFWNTFDNLKSTHSSHASDPDPTPVSFGYGSGLASTTNVEEIFESTTNTKPLDVKEGEWIGNFSGSSGQKIGFEVVLENDGLVPIDLDFLAAAEYKINTGAASGFALKTIREKIFAFADPAAYFGLHHEAGMSVGSSSTPVVDLYTEVISKFVNKDKVYLDIRSELGYSYNFHENYPDPSSSNIQVGSSSSNLTTKLFKTSDWPLLVLPGADISTTSGVNSTAIKIRIDDNTTPQLFSNNSNIFDSPAKKYLKQSEILNGSATDWSKAITLRFPTLTPVAGTPTTIAYYLKLHHFRKQYNAASPTTVMKSEYYYDLAFCPINMLNLGNTSFPSMQVAETEKAYVKGIYPVTSEPFDYSATRGACWDSTRILFYTDMVKANESTGKKFPADSTKGPQHFGISLTAPSDRHHIVTDIRIAITTIQELTTPPSTYTAARVFDVASRSSGSDAMEGLLCLGITLSELSALKTPATRKLISNGTNSVPLLDNSRSAYIYIKELTGSPFTDKHGRTFRKFELKTRGYNTNGDLIEGTPASPIEVYSINGFFFSSKSFTSAETITEAYKRSVEEAPGDTLFKKTGMTYENFYIKATGNLNAEVNAFTNGIAAISPTNPDAYALIKTLVQQKAKTIWDEGVIRVKTLVSNKYPLGEDRALYWARTKCIAALQGHDYFLGQFANPYPKKGTELDELRTIFERKSRNHDGIDFSSGNTNFTSALSQNPSAKRILISGFDPFPIWYDPEAYNPSAMIALALHNKVVMNGASPVGLIQSYILPVRYRDFDAKVVEFVAETQLNNGSLAPHMIITISLDDSSHEFNIERWATRYRGGYPDNEQVGKGWKAGYHDINDFVGNNFYETTLPCPQIFDNTGLKVGIRQDYTAKKSSKKKFESVTYTPDPASNAMDKFDTMTQGSGGNYFSNESFYRVAAARQRTTPGTKTGHIHIPMGYEEDNEDNYSITTIIDKMMSTIEKAIPYI
jgi:pyrrolidone-carboxylate peptidase